MRELSFVPLFVTVLFVGRFLPSHAEVKNEKAPQVGEDPRTYVVRYKNGDQTIPVTVVLDYKKQTEYVINMNPRTPAKSVTLYDFKQRTIAYKDLTNRECFLGRLTFETLNEETDALNKVQNPVDHQPKFLSLDPQRAALTPTEIRNIAGQRTAVFCRKMNTWLIMPKDSHSIHKRETEEVEERTYHRHGYHTVRYSHYGRETRRRFRNSRRNDSKPLLYKNENTSNPKPSISELNSFTDENIPPHQTPYHLQHHLPGIQKPDLSSSDSLSKSNTASAYENNPSLPNAPNRLSAPSEHGFHTPFSSDLQNKNGLLHKISERTIDQPHIPNRPFNTGHSNTGYERRTLNASENTDEVKLREHVNAQYVRSPVFTEDTLESKIHPETSDSSFHNPGINGNIYPPEISSYDYPPVIPVSNRQSQIETEWSANDTLPQFIPERTFHHTGDHNIPENPDVSTNVLEIPKNSKKFENFGLNQGSPVLVPQTNEDVHDIFEGFYNLKDNNSPTNPNYFHNSHFIPPESDPHIVRSETSPTKYLPPLSHSNSSNSNLPWRGNTLPYTTTDASSDSPHFTTANYEDVTRVIPPNLLIRPNVITSHRKYNTHRFEENVPYHAHASNSYERPRTLPEPNFVPGPQLESSNSVASNYFTTESPAFLHRHYNGINHRSDIPSEIDHGENVGTFPQANVGKESLNTLRNNRSRPLLLPTEAVREGVSTPQIRFQPALHNYKPDEIVINVEVIPTQRPSENIAGFQDRAFVTNEANRKSTPSVLFTTAKRSDQISGGTWRSTYSPSVRNPSRTIHNGIPKQHQNGNGRTFHQRQPFVSPQRHRDGVNEFPRHPVNNLNRHGNVPLHSDPNQPHYPRTFEQPHYPLDALPPGVSIHPRHPNAPFADMFHSNIPPPLPQENNVRIVKTHRQRHHRKKNRLTNCCRGGGKSNGNPSSCCRNGGSCCSGHLGKTIPSRSSCCQNGKNNRGQFHPPRRNPIAVANKAPDIRTPHDTHNRQAYTVHNSKVDQVPSQQEHRTVGDNRDVKDFPTRQNRMLPSNDSPQIQPRRTLEDNRERCLKEKMCRTVYESTQQVIVCRNADIAGCS